MPTPLTPILVAKGKDDVVLYPHDGEPPRAHRRRHRHRQDGHAQGPGRAASAAWASPCSWPM